MPDNPNYPELIRLGGYCLKCGLVHQGILRPGGHGGYFGDCNGSPTTGDVVPIYAFKADIQKADQGTQGNED